MNKLSVQYAKSVIRRTSSYAAWRAKQSVQRSKLFWMSDGALADSWEWLLSDDRCGWERPEITITLPVRHLGHRANYIEEYLESFVKMTHNPERVEMLIRVDEDDDPRFFCDIKRRYRDRINMHFARGPRLDGYASLHRYYASLIPLHSSSSSIWVLQSADALLVLPGWDSVLLVALKGRYRDYFVATDCPFEEAVSIKGPFPVEPTPVYWIRGALFPVIGFGVLRCAEEVARKHLNWTCLGNTTNVDGFAGDLIRRLWQRHGINMHVEIPQFAVENKPTGWYGVKGRHELRTRNLLTFFEERTQAVRGEMVDLIAKEKL